MPASGRAPPAAAVVDARYALGSRRRDVVAFVSLALLVVIAAPFLRVYYRVTVAEVTLTRIDPDGTRHRLAVPDEVWNARRRVVAGRQRPAAMLRSQEALIRRFMATDARLASSPPGTRFEWRIRYAENSTRLDRDALIVVSPSGEAHR